MERGSKGKSAMAPALLESHTRKRKEVVLTREEAMKKKLPKGYVLEPVPPAIPLRPVVAADEGKKKRAEVSKRVGAPFSSLPSNNVTGVAEPGLNGSSDPDAPYNRTSKGPGVERTSPEAVQSFGVGERVELRGVFGSELDFLQRVLQEVEARELDLSERPVSGGSVAAGDARKRQRRETEIGGTQNFSPPALQMPDGGLGEASQSNTPLPRLKHSHSMQMSGGDSVGALTPKRTPKANTVYINQDFVSGQDKLPPPEKQKPKSAALKKSGSSSNMNGGRTVDVNDPKRQRVEASRSRRMVEILRQCQTVLKKSMSHKYSWVFNKPVDVEALGLHDYLTIIKKPMDLGTVNQRLKASLYQHPDEFHTDVSLVWSNAMTYNQPGSDVYLMAAELKRMFEENYRKIRAKIQEDVVKREQEEKELREWTPAREKSEVLELERRLLALENQVQVAQAAAAQKPKSRGTPSLPKPKPGDVNKREMTYQEKQKLSINLGKLPSERLDRVLQIITEHNPNFGSQQGEEIELDIDALDKDTLWELDRYVSNCMKSKSKMKKNAAPAQPATRHAPGPIHAAVPSSLPGSTQQVAIPEAESFRGRQGGGDGEDSVNIEDVGPPGPSASSMGAHKDAQSAKSEDSSSDSATSDDSSSSSDSGSDSGSDSEGDEAQSKDVVARGGGGKGLVSAPTHARAGAEACKGADASLTEGRGLGTATTGTGPSETATPAAGVVGEGALEDSRIMKVPEVDTAGGAPGTPASPVEADTAAVASEAVAASSNAESGAPVVDDEVTLRAALARQKYADIILKAKSRAIQGPVADPRAREALEKQQKEERAKIEAAAKAAQEAARRKAEQAAAAAKQRREEEREAERQRLLQMERTVELDENHRVLKELHIFGADSSRTPIRQAEERGGGGGADAGVASAGFPGLGASVGGSALGNFGFELAESDDEENDGAGNPEDVEEGEI